MKNIIQNISSGIYVRRVGEDSPVIIFLYDEQDLSPNERDPQGIGGG